MAVYIVNGSNWDDPAFWAGVSQAASGHTLDFSALGGAFSVEVNPWTGAITLSDGVSTFTVGDASYGGGSDASLGGATLLTYFDTLTGSQGDDTLHSAGGAQTLSGGAGDDTVVLYDGFGADIIDGGSGSDTVDMSSVTTGVTVDYHGDGWGVADDGTDTISFSNTEVWQLTDQADLFTAGADTLGVTAYGNGGDDTMWGGLGGDTLDGGDGIDTIYGDTGDDTIYGGAGNDDLGGDGGNDTIYGGAGDDYLEGSTGDDTLDGGIGNDDLVGGSGADIFRFQDGFGTDTVNGGETGTDDDLMDFSGLSSAVNMVFSGAEAGNVTNGANAVSFGNIEAGTLTDFNDTVDAASASTGVVIDAGAGNDFVVTGAGDDDITGGTGNDTVATGGGIDVIDLGVGSDTIAISDTAGSATIDLGVIGDDFDNATFVNDVSTVGVTVTYSGDEAFDYTFGAGTGSVSGVERITSTQYDDVIDGSSSTAQIFVDSGAGDDIVTGGTANDQITGGQGDDILDGGAGHDTFYISDLSGNDTIIGGEGNDTLYLGNLTSGVDITFSGDGAGSFSIGAYTVTFTGIERISLTNYDDVVDASANSADMLIWGNAGDDVITGGAGDDTIFGGDGADVLRGGLGNDTYYGQADADTIVLEQGGGADRVIGFDNTDPEVDGSYVDQIDVLGLEDLAGGGIEAMDVSTSDNAGSAMVLFPEGETLTFSGIDESALNTYQNYTALGIPCFTPGTLIRTGQGEVPIERLRPGDMVLTRDNGPQPILWAAARRLGAAELAAHEGLRPIAIKPGAFGQEAGLIVSPQHGVLLGVEGEETLVRANHLARLEGGGVRVMRGCRKVTYIHLFFESHQVIWGNGLPSESFYPGPMALGGLEQGARTQLFDLVPDLMSVADLAGAATAYCDPARAYSRMGKMPDHLGALNAI